MTLYETLGLPPDADDAAIKAAYRQKSKQHHPDVGGDREMFEAVQLAYDVLSDEDKRAAYDLTGVVPNQGSALNDETAVRVAATNLVMNIIMGLPNPDTIEIIATAREKVRENTAGAEDAIAKLQAFIDRMPKVMKRVRRREGENVLQRMLLDRVEGMKAMIEMHRKHIEFHGRVMKFLEDYSFDRDDMIIYRQIGYANVSTSTLTSRY